MSLDQSNWHTSHESLGILEQIPKGPGAGQAHLGTSVMTRQSDGDPEPDGAEHGDLATAKNLYSSITLPLTVVHCAAHASKS